MVKKGAKKNQGANTEEHGTNHHALFDGVDEDDTVMYKEENESETEEERSNDEEQDTVVQQATSTDEKSTEDDEGLPSLASLEKKAIKDDVSQKLSFPKKHPSTIDMICDALENLGEKKGSAPVAIKQYIMGKYPELNANRFKFQFKRAFLKGIETGELLRTKATADAVGVTGRVRLAPKKPKAKSKVLANRKAAMATEKGGETSSESAEEEPLPKPAKKASKPAPKEKAEKPRRNTTATKSKPKEKSEDGDKDIPKRGRKPKSAKAENGEMNEDHVKPKKPTKAKPAASKQAEKTDTKAATKPPTKQKAPPAKASKEPAKKTAKTGKVSR
ncbi:histone H1, early embryonic-like [Ornithodoros turicata]|uniref:histone H1, early embryonic-like n=1 Tax=Ornithodoros turicata TaxID=34597 RepID=UPI00313A41DD